MDNGSGLSAADVALLNNDGMGGWNGMIWLFAIIALMGGGFGGWGNNNFANAIGYENLATSNEVQRGFDNQNLQAQTRDILNAVTNGTAQTIQSSTQNASNAINAIKDGNASLIREFGTVETALTALSGKQQECCCNILQKIGETNAATNSLIQQTNYEGAMRDAQTNANLTAQIQSVKDMISQNKVDALQAQVSQLQLAQATSGMLRFPDSWAYGAGAFPPIFGGCCGQGNI